ncbi:MAG: hypothetical protein KME10_14050 [Plectolyngbya sp. WJT66-NPBG17]|nr:hypothetical protein [Plectolyngbya sp. WJT66-NPBG17]MBW4526414.1 cyclic phosphodiesterase-like protein [Phormidium tanganyikae FI6-MK23]
MKVAFWLIPVESDRVFYQSLINDLAHRYNAPIFQPHVTLFSGECDRASEFPQRTVEIVLEIDRIRYSEQFTKTLFIQLFSNPKLEQLSESIQQHFGSSYSLDPHLSLIYASLSEMEKRSLTEQVQLSDRVIRFDRICAMEIPTKPQTREDVQAWREID